MTVKRATKAIILLASLRGRATRGPVDVPWEELVGAALAALAEPTPAMVEAGKQAYVDYILGSKEGGVMGTTSCFAAIWRAMHAAMMREHG